MSPVEVEAGRERRERQGALGVARGFRRGRGVAGVLKGGAGGLAGGRRGAELGPKWAGCCRAAGAL